MGLWHLNIYVQCIMPIQIKLIFSSNTYHFLILKTLKSFLLFFWLLEKNISNIFLLTTDSQKDNWVWRNQKQIGLFLCISGSDGSWLEPPRPQFEGGLKVKTQRHPEKKTQQCRCRCEISWSSRADTTSNAAATCQHSIGQTTYWCSSTAASLIIYFNFCLHNFLSTVSNTSSPFPLPATSLSICNLSKWYDAKE